MVDPFGLKGQLLDGQFRVDAQIGEGGFSAVYRGTHVGLGEPIAIKCLKLTGALMQGSAIVDSFVQRFRDESRILYKLGQGNLNIVRCIASGTTIAPATGALVPYMVLEWLEGQTLEADLAARPGPRSLAETMALLGPVLEAMAHAHALGVIHRDLSTTNIFLARRGEGATAGTMAKVLDFGVAKVIGDDLALGPRAATLAQIKIFSPAYAAPEQFDARLAPAGPQTDVYSLALIAVEVLTGRMVRPSGTIGEMMQHALDPNAARTPRDLGVAVADSVEKVLARALSIDASKRQKDAAELSRELRGAQSIAIGRPPIDLGTTTRAPSSFEEPPSTDPAPQPGAAPNLSGLRSTARMSSPPSTSPPAPPAPPAVVVPAAAPSAGQLFQAPAAPVPPGVPMPEPSASIMASLSATRVEPVGTTTMPSNKPLPPPNNPALQTTKEPMSERTALRAQWLVGMLVFIAVLAAGALVLKMWVLR